MRIKIRNNNQQYIKRRNLNELLLVAKIWKEVDFFTVYISKLKVKVKISIMKLEASITLEGVCPSLQKKRRKYMRNY